MIDTDLALQKILDALPSPDSTELDLDAALGHVLARPAIAALDLPPFDQSAVDGYAVRHADIADAPLALPVVQTIAAAARDAAPVLAPGTAARIFTGGWLPLHADTSVRQELTERDGDRVRVLQALPLRAQELLLLQLPLRPGLQQVARPQLIRQVTCSLPLAKGRRSKGL